MERLCRVTFENGKKSNEIIFIEPITGKLTYAKHLSEKIEHEN